MGIERATYQGTYRAGVIGHTGRGNYGHGLDVAFVGLPNVRLVAVADADDEGRAEAMGRTGAERAYADYRDMLAQENLDLVAIGPRWLDQHEAMTIAAAEAGVKAIYAEKPMAPSLEVADRMLAACDRHGVKIAYAHQNRAYPGPALVREYIAAGKLGRLRVIRAFGKQDRRGGGMDLLVLGTHLLDLMRLFAGDARWCHGHVTRNGHDATVADIEVAQEEGGLIAGDDVIAQYGFDHGVLGTYECGRAGDGGGSPYFRVEVCGTDSMLTLWSSPDAPIYMFPGPFAPPDRLSEWQLVESEPLPPALGPESSRGGMHTANQLVVCDLLAAVEEGRAPAMSSGHDTRAALEMILAVYESHRQGARVALPLADRRHPLARWQSEA